MNKIYSFPRFKIFCNLLKKTRTRLYTLLSRISYPRVRKSSTALCFTKEETELEEGKAHSILRQKQRWMQNSSLLRLWAGIFLHSSHSTDLYPLNISLAFSRPLFKSPPISLKYINPRHLQYFWIRDTIILFKIGHDTLLCDNFPTLINNLYKHQVLCSFLTLPPAGKSLYQFLLL